MSELYQKCSHSTPKPQQTAMSSWTSSFPRYFHQPNGNVTTKSGAAAPVLRLRADYTITGVGSTQVSRLRRAQSRATCVPTGAGRSPPPPAAGGGRLSPTLKSTSRVWQRIPEKASRRLPAEKRQKSALSALSRGGTSQPFGETGDSLKRRCSCGGAGASAPTGKKRAPAPSRDPKLILSAGAALSSANISL